MSLGNRIGNAFRRISWASSTHMVRGEDAARVDRHGGSVRELNQRATSFAKEAERTARRLEKDL